MMIPVVQDLARTCRLPAKHLFIPLSFASILGGTCTLIGTSTNLVIGGLVSDAINRGGTDLPAMRPIAMFDTTLVALPLTIAGIAFMVLFGRWLLPKVSVAKDEKVRWRQYRAEFEVHASSRLIGQTLNESGLLGIPGSRLLSVSRNDKRHHAFRDLGPLAVGDILAFSVTRAALAELWRTNRLVPTSDRNQCKPSGIRTTWPRSSLPARAWPSDGGSPIYPFRGTTTITRWWPSRATGNRSAARSKR